MSNSSVLAIKGGERVIDYELKRYNSIGQEEIDAVVGVMQSGILSKFIGAWDEDFYGGPKVQELEQVCREYFGVRHAISVNSWTSGLIAAVGAIGIEPGDEVIVSPFTMCASATAIVHWNAIPVFADIDRNTFCLNPKEVEKKITPKTKAIMAVDIFGQSADMDNLSKIANKYNLKIISDTAQSPGSMYRDKYSGTLGDIGGFSLNYHKHIHCGEGGILVTNDDIYADKLRLIRNHAEAVVEDKGYSSLANMIGYNFRLGELECAIAIEQLKKLPQIIKRRQEIAGLLTSSLSGMRGLLIPSPVSCGSHVYYVYPMVLDIKHLDCTRQDIVDALRAEGVEGVFGGYQNIHLLPMYQEKIAYGSKGFPWNNDSYLHPIDYSPGICPVAEELHNETFIGLQMCMHELPDNDVHLIIRAFKKVWKALID